MFRRLDLGPRPLDVLGREIRASVREHMRVPPDQFSGDRLDDTAEVEGVLLLGHARVEDDLKQQVAEFVTQVR
jgi:hypothetical protein